jgi:hypothetical protein
LPERFHGKFEPKAERTKLTRAELEDIAHNALGLRTEKYDEFVPTTLFQQFCGRLNAFAIRSIPKIARKLLASADR